MTSPAKTKSAWLLATWFGCGYSPKAPGTAGAAAATVLAAALSLAGAGQFTFLFLSIAALYPAILAAGTVAHESGRKDPQIVVVDEVIGQWITYAGALRMNWRSLLIGLVLFRIFDILKPPPIRLIEGIPGGAGIVLDDVMAGIYAALVLFLLGWFNLSY